MKMETPLSQLQYEKSGAGGEVYEGHSLTLKRGREKKKLCNGRLTEKWGLTKG